MNILVIHTNYTQFGGEDAVVKQEIVLLKQYHNVDSLFFKNQKGIVGFTQFLLSIWNIKSANTVKKKIKDFKPDIIHLHNWHFASGPVIIRTAKKLGVPIVHTLHNYRIICPSAILFHKNDLFLKSFNQPFPWTAVFRKVYKNSIGLTFWLAVIVWVHKILGTWKMINTYICLTPQAIDLFSKSKLGVPSYKFVSKPNFSPLNLNQDIFHREDYFLFIGRLTEEKGIKLLINAFKDLPYKLKIAGDGPLKSYVQDSVINYSNITFLGVLNKENVCLKLKKANALIFPSICIETFGLVITEAFSNACAVLSTNIGAPKSLIENGKNGLHFKSNNKKDLISIIKQWESLNLDEKQAMRNHALNTFLNKYSPEKQNDYFSKIYKKAIKMN